GRDRPRLDFRCRTPAMLRMCASLFDEPLARMIHQRATFTSVQPSIRETPWRKGIPRLNSARLPVLSRLEFSVPELAAPEQSFVLGAEHRLVVFDLGISFRRHADLLRLEVGQDLLLQAAELVVGLQPASGVVDITGMG